MRRVWLPNSLLIRALYICLMISIAFSLPLTLPNHNTTLRALSTNTEDSTCFASWEYLDMMDEPINAKDKQCNIELDDIFVEDSEEEDTVGIRYIYTDLDARFAPDFGLFKGFLHDLINSCSHQIIGNTFVSTTFDPDNTSATRAFICCTDSECIGHLTEVQQDLYYRPYLHGDRLVYDDEDDASFIGNYTITWYDETKKIKTPCNKNSFIFITSRIMDIAVSGLPTAVRDFRDRWRNLCIQPTIILVGRPAKEKATLEYYYGNITENLFVVPNASCLHVIAKCIKPCMVSNDSCKDLDLENCEIPPTTTSTSTTTTTTTPTTPTTTIEPPATSLHILYAVALSDTLKNKFENIKENIEEAVKLYLDETHNNEIAAQFFATPEDTSKQWILNIDTFHDRLDNMNDSVLVKNVEHNDTDNKTTIVVDNVEHALKYYDNNHQTRKSTDAAPLLIVMTDFYSWKFWRYMLDHPITTRFDVHMYVYNYAAYNIFKSASNRVVDLRMLHYLDPDHLVVIPLDPTDPKEDDNVGLSETELIVIIIGSVIFLLAIMALMTFLYTKKLSWMRRIENFSKTHEDVTAIVQDFWELSWDRLLIKSEKIGSGAYGQVFRGKVHGKPPCVDHVYVNSSLPVENQYEDCDVAIKMLPRYASEMAKREFLHEIELMKKISGRNDNIIDMLGCITVGHTICLVLEYCPNRDLLHYVKAVNVDVQESTSLEAKLNLTKEFMLFAWHVCDGMRYLASQNVIHRDLAARNILIDRHNCAKISDFGLCIELSNNGYSNSIYTSNSGRLPIKWLAIEALLKHEFSTKSDVWSFGILLFEMYSFGETPFATIPTKEIGEHLTAGGRPYKPELCPEEMFNIMKFCWLQNPDQRPEFKLLTEKVAIVLERASESYGYLDLTSDISTAPNYMKIKKTFRNAEGIDEKQRSAFRNRILTRESTASDSNRPPTPSSPPPVSPPANSQAKRMKFFFSRGHSKDQSKDTYDMPPVT
ncbi:unnamed protein product [Bursaphelenchus okinawaensis]|uniref:Protein kinase domain-containing protein n=1 Tax=Bursaphelenchus okinawaensis TaxID=465554 RepID=A0A811L622_9BILA|nr:unnamed protein product [Bursaphelenchus okinawaensis]CAG9118222.1 unnamed protein product [Bursaphelenchus okinawaensis]